MRMTVTETSRYRYTPGNESEVLCFLSPRKLVTEIVMDEGRVPLQTVVSVMKERVGRPSGGQRLL